LAQRISMRLIQGDCLVEMQKLEDNSVDSIVVDPPYGISFMGKKWDYNVPKVEVWQEALRVLKAGGHALVACGTRTQHRMAVNLEDAGFEIRDIVFYHYGSGFPKSLNIFKTLTKKCTCGFMEAYEKNRNEWNLSCQQETEYSLRPLPKTDISQTVNAKDKQGKVLQSSLSEQSVPIQQSKSAENVWSRQPGMEGRYNAEKDTWQLSGSDVYSLPERISAYGEEGWVHNDTQIGNGSIAGENINKNRGSSSQRSQSEQQQDREPCAFCKQFRAQAIRALGYGTALKPSTELWTLCRKPLSEKTVAKNVLKYGTGGINIDGCRVNLNGEKQPTGSGNSCGENATSWDVAKSSGGNGGNKTSSLGRFPANLIHDGSDEVVGLFPDSNGSGKARKLQRSVKPEQDGWGMNKNSADEVKLPDAGSGSASRFFYCAKASKSERNKGLEGFEEKERTPRGNNQGVRYCVDCGLTDNYKNDHSKCSGKFEYKLSKPMKNNHPTIKPINLMRYLCRLITPKGGTILDPFMGSGSTGIGAKLENFNFIGIELDEDYFNIAKSRIENYIVQTELFNE